MDCFASLAMTGIALAIKWLRETAYSFAMRVTTIVAQSN